MLLRILKSNQAYNLFLFPLTALGLWASGLISPRTYNFFEGENQNVLFKPVYNLLDGNPFVQVLVSLILVIVIGFLVQKVNNQYAFFRFRTLLPSSLVVIILSSISMLHTLHPVFFGALFLLLATDRILRAYEKKVVNSNAIDAGLLLGIGSLFYFNLIYLFPALILALRIISLEFNWRALTLFFWGILLPWIFAFSIFFLMDRPGDLIIIINRNVSTPNYRIEGKIPLIIYTGFWAFLLLIGSLEVIRKSDKQKISTRKYYSILLLFILAIAAIFILSPAASVEISVLWAIPSAFILSNLFLSVKNRLLSELIFAVFLGLVIYMQFV